MTAGSPTLSIQRFRDFWIHTGTACNLSCPFCHEGSKPGDERLQAPTLAELTPLLREAVALGVERFVFTGGEPLILKGIHEILLGALELKPALVLTNGTAPFIRRSHQLAALRTAPHALTFHVSIDSPEESVHDAGRGLKNFRKALEGLRLLHEAGFATGIISQPHAQADTAAIRSRFRQLLRRQQLPQEIPVYCIPELGTLHAEPSGTRAATPALANVGGPMIPPCCLHGRMLIKRRNALWLTACPLVDDDPSFDRPPQLSEAVATPVQALHRRCATCLVSGVRYGGL